MESESKRLATREECREGFAEVFANYVELLAEVFAGKCYFLTDNPMSLKEWSVYSVRVIPPEISWLCWVMLRATLASHLSWSWCMETFMIVCTGKCIMKFGSLIFRLTFQKLSTYCSGLRKGRGSFARKGLFTEIWRATNILVRCEQLGASSSSAFNPTRICAKVVELGLSKINEMNCTP